MHSKPENWRHVGVPSLWCVIGNDSYKPPHGQLLTIKDES